ncbi:MAG: MaoC family dehydratase N-terminal domain-containing protein [Dehalococcoidia bacterium]|nr:MaoC family dehydratase N-terminal domain-containing protein [Dehalococcoidia bacterium]
MSEKELVYDEIEVGREFDPPVLNLTEEAVKKYLQAVEDDSSIYQDQTAALDAAVGWPVAPPTTAAIFSRTSVLFQKEGKMPPGSIHARQEFQFVAPLRPGDVLTTKARVAEKFVRKDRKWMVIESTTVNQRGETVVIGRMTGIWPK